MGCKLVQKYYKYAHDYVDEKKTQKKFLSILLYLGINYGILSKG